MIPNRHRASLRSRWATLASVFGHAFLSILLVSSLVGQAQWTPNRGVTTLPPVGAVIADYPTAGHVVSFEGYLGGGPTNETWIWSGAAWQPMSVTPAPSARIHAALGYDPDRAVLYLFGGNDPVGVRYLNDMWAWNGTAWTLVTWSGSGPAAREAAALAFDHVSRRMLLFGGSGANGSGAVYYRDTWAFDGQNWTQLMPSIVPAARSHHRMAADEGRRRIVLYGGQLVGLADSALLEWNGVDWQRLAPAVGPVDRIVGHGLAYDSVRGLTVMFGGRTAGSGNTPLADTWEWDGRSWSLRDSGTVGLGGRHVHGMCYYTTGARTMILAGWNGSQFLYDQWEWQSPRLADYRVAGAGCSSGGMQPVLSAGAYGPWSDDDFDVSLALGTRNPNSAVMLTGFSNTTWAGRNLPVLLDPYGLTGCSLGIAAEIAYPMSLSGGTWTWSARIPPDQAFWGARFWQQAVLLEPGVNSAGATLSLAAEATIGVR